MAFNADSYRLHRYLADKAKRMAEAREIKARILAGIAYDWEAERLPRVVALARSSSRLARSQRIIRDLKRNQ